MRFSRMIHRIFFLSEKLRKCNQGLFTINVEDLKRNEMLISGGDIKYE